MIKFSCIILLILTIGVFLCCGGCSYSYEVLKPSEMPQVVRLTEHMSDENAVAAIQSVLDTGLSLQGPGSQVSLNATGFNVLSQYNTQESVSLKRLGNTEIKYWEVESEQVTERFSVGFDKISHIGLLNYPGMPRMALFVYDCNLEPTADTPPKFRIFVKPSRADEFLAALYVLCPQLRR